MTPSAMLGPLLLTALAAEAPSPSPTEPVHTIYTVTPGISGFITFFVLALIGWLLFRSLTRHVRKVDQERLRRERLVQEGSRDVEPAAERAGSAGEPGARADEPGDDPRR